RERVAPRWTRVLLHADRPHRALPPDARPRGVLPDGVGRQRTADRAPRAALLRGAVRPFAALRPVVRAARRETQAAAAHLAAQLRGAVPPADRAGRAGLRGPVAPARTVRGLVAALHDDRRPGAGRRAARVPAQP